MRKLDYKTREDVVIVAFFNTLSFETRAYARCICHADVSTLRVFMTYGQTVTSMCIITGTKAPRSLVVSGREVASVVCDLTVFTLEGTRVRYTAAGVILYGRREKKKTRMLSYDS